jgi:4-hydroxy-2-oxoheptanedioate aldolase
MYYMLDRRQILKLGSLAPAVAPFVRIPPNGGELNQFFAKQVLDIGVYGVIWPHVSTVEDARNAVAACRYPRPPSAPFYEPAGVRGDSPRRAARYWGLTNDEYYARADVWPLNPKGEILVIIMCEEVRAIKNLPKILEQGPGIGVVLIGDGDLSQDLGLPRQYDHPTVVSAMDEIWRSVRTITWFAAIPRERQERGTPAGKGIPVLMPRPAIRLRGSKKGSKLREEFKS